MINSKILSPNYFIIMKLYMTIEPLSTLKYVFTNLRSFEIIDVDFIINDIGLDVTKERNAFIVNNEIVDLLKNYSRSRRTSGIIYVNRNLNCNVINSIRDTLAGYDKSLVDELILMDNRDVPRVSSLYPCVDEVLYFTAFKRVRIIECKPIPNFNI